MKSDKRGEHRRDEQELNSRKVRVSVIVPAFRVEAYLAETLDSILGQTMPDWECMVVVDGSLDNSEAIALQYAARDPRIRVHSYHPNQGTSHARNRGAERTKGKYLIFIDSDDLFLPAGLQVLADTLDAHPEAVSVYGRYETFGEGVAPERPPLNDSLTFLERMFEFVPMGLHISNHMVRREAFEVIGGYDENLFFSEDWMFWVQLAHRYPGRLIGKDSLTCRIRKHSEQLSRKLRKIENSMDSCQKMVFTMGMYPSVSYYRRSRAIFALIMSASYIKGQGNYRDGLRCALQAFRWSPRQCFRRLVYQLRKP